jgi:ESS family glutamate:Na+ symporter
MTISAWWLLVGALPVVALGQGLVRSIKALDRLNIPVPVVGGLAVSAVVLLVNILELAELKIQTTVTTAWWTWLVTTPQEWSQGAPKDIYQPMLVGFFTCIGLNASVAVARQGGLPLVIYLVISVVLAAMQNVVGVVLAQAAGAPPLLGMICGSVTLVGGLGTAIGLAESFVSAGFEQAKVVGAAAATFGMVIGGVIGGSIGGRLIRQRRLRAEIAPVAHNDAPRESHEPETLLTQVLAVLRGGWRSLLCLAILMACTKAGAWIGWQVFEWSGTKVPAQMGAMLLGLMLRNLLDLTGLKWIDDHIVNAWGSLLLTLLLAMAMAGLDLAALLNLAGPMVLILAGQVVLIVVFCQVICFLAMGRDYDAALMATGLCGFGLGGTSNALASMETLTRKYGPSPRAFLIVSIVGGFLVDVPNILMINQLIPWLK